LSRAYHGHLTSPISILVLGVDDEDDTSDETGALMLLYLDAEGDPAFLLSIPQDLCVKVPDHWSYRLSTKRNGGTVRPLGSDRFDWGFVIYQFVIYNAAQWSFSSHSSVSSSAVWSIGSALISPSGGASPVPTALTVGKNAQGGSGLPCLPI
jgi:hypothetical protein